MDKSTITAEDLKNNPELEHELFVKFMKKNSTNRKHRNRKYRHFIGELEYVSKDISLTINSTITKDGNKLGKRQIQKVVKKKEEKLQKAFEDCKNGNFITDEQWEEIIKKRKEKEQKNT